MRQMVLLVAMTIVITACAGPVEHGVWTAPDRDERRLHADEYECDREARLTYGSAAYDRDRGAPGLASYERCMKSRGYVRVR